MKAIFVSDIHLAPYYPNSIDFYSKFEKHILTDSTYTHLYFLGDIFDALIGPSKKALLDYSFFFESLDKFHQRGLEIHYLEGNHDFHLRKLFKKFFPFVHYHETGFRVEFNDTKVWLCHGYEVDHENEAFQKWYKIYSSWWIKIIATYILPYNLIKFIAHRASRNSRERGKIDFDENRYREKYRKGAEHFFHHKTSEDIDVLIAGHTHIQDDYVIHKNKRYINGGAAPLEKKVLIYDNIFSMLEIT